MKSSSLIFLLICCLSAIWSSCVLDEKIQPTPPFLIANSSSEPIPALSIINDQTNVSGQSVSYWINYRQGHESDKILLWLHGTGEKGNGTIQPAVHGPQKYLLNGSDDLCYNDPLTGELICYTVIVPQLPTVFGEWAQGPSSVPNSVINHIANHYPQFDLSDITIMGYSLGAKGIIKVVEKWPSNGLPALSNFPYSQGVFIAGDNFGWGQQQFCDIWIDEYDLDVWSFHGRNDPVFGINHAINRHDWLDNCPNGDSVIRSLTIFENQGHNIPNLIVNPNTAPIEGESLSIYEILLGFNQQSTPNPDSTNADLQLNDIIKLNFTKSPYFANDGTWNNLLDMPDAGTIYGDLKRVSGDTTEVELQLLNSWNGVSTSGETFTDFPTAVSTTNFWFRDDTMRMEINHLDVSFAYDLSFFGSYNSQSDRNTIFRINGQESTYNARKNTSDTADFSNVNADENGKISIDVFTGDNTVFGLMASLILTVVEDSPSDSTINPGPQHNPLQSGDSLKLNFTNTTQLADATWNNLNDTPAANTKYDLLISNQGDTTSIGLELVDKWKGISQSGEVGTIYPDEVGTTNFWFREDVLEMKINNLDKSLLYDLSFFGSYNRQVDTYTVVDINGVTSSYNSRKNLNQQAEFQNVAADAEGTITIFISSGDNTIFVYLSSLIVVAK